MLQDIQGVSVSVANSKSRKSMTDHAACSVKRETPPRRPIARLVQLVDRLARLAQRVDRLLRRLAQLRERLRDLLGAASPAPASLRSPIRRAAPAPAPAG